MKITDHVGEKFCGYTLPPYRLYEPETPCNVDVLFGHGMGEEGPMDGSELYEVDKWGLPMLAKGIRPGQTVVTGTREFPYNIVAIQVQESYSVSNKYILQWMRWRRKAVVVGATGLSLGGLMTYNLWSTDEEKILDFIVPVCGYLGADRIPFLRPIPVQSWHGTLDKQVSYNTDLNFVTRYNATLNLPKIDWHPLEGVDHNAWTPAYKSPLLHGFIETQIVLALKARQSQTEQVKSKIIDLLNTLK